VNVLQAARGYFCIGDALAAVCACHVDGLLGQVRRDFRRYGPHRPLQRLQPRTLAARGARRAPSAAIRSGAPRRPSPSLLPWSQTKLCDVGAQRSSAARRRRRRSCSKSVAHPNPRDGAKCALPPPTHRWPPPLCNCRAACMCVAVTYRDMCRSAARAPAARFTKLRVAPASIWFRQSRNPSSIHSHLTALLGASGPAQSSACRRGPGQGHVV
jgi:hypothetical protein